MARPCGMKKYWYYNQYHAINQLIINELPVMIAYDTLRTDGLRDFE
jgi:hypothetical protein